ncbi:hypothetical protein COV20_03600 [Candidatus Woesearchaeota archaeon CG10_big_fil_rev_8_21_14_0_10_45_16]|nr:MAG: hypothetical protein COV20_03600 [Candidatus Woesearchaeota archaeon CG10_big_fil_rev_8_21_14_0_10_45_16]
MKIKRVVKRLFAVGAGVGMLGATAMGALAANLNTYPDMFVADGTFNGLLVVGEAAASVDNLAVTDIATSMMYHSGAAGTSSVSVSGDAWLVESGSDVLEFSESIGPSTHGVVDFLDDTDLAALESGELRSSQGTFQYEQFLHFDNAVINSTYAEDDDDVTNLFVYIKDNAMFARYELNFLDAAESDIDASESFKLDDYEDKQLTMFGKTYDIVKAVTGGALSSQVTLTLMSGSANGVLMEGESQTFNVGGKDYEISLTFTDTNNRAKFVINGQTTPLMDEGDTETLSDGTVLGLSEVLYQDYAGGVHQAEFFLGADKIELQDDSINATGSTDELKINDETIDGADVEIIGTMLDQATSTTEDGELEIDSIVINMTAQNDYYVAVGETLLGQPELDEKPLVFSENWDLSFVGLADVATDMISVKDKSGEKEYELTFTNVNGDVINLPLAYASAATSMRPGTQDDVLHLNNSEIGDEQYFILNDDNDEDSVSNVIQYKGADDNSKSDPKIKFKILATGETVDRPITFGANAASATLRLAGTTFTIANVTTAGGNTGVKDWNISVTGGVDTSSFTGGAFGGNMTNYVIARGGAKIFIQDFNTSLGTDALRWNVSLIDTDAVDDRTAATSGAVAVPYQVIGADITAASSELDLANFVGITLTSPNDDDDNNYGYSINGAWVKRYTPTGSGTSADQIEVEWPQVERTVDLYVTSGAVSTSARRSGDLVAVTVVDATRLDSEVADLAAQNLIVVGGPCVNTVAASLLGNPADCTEGFTPGKARIKLFEQSNGNVAMLVAGYSGEDTRRAGRVIATRWEELSGSEVEVEGTTASDARISAPSAAPAGDAMVDDAMVE